MPNQSLLDVIEEIAQETLRHEQVLLDLLRYLARHSHPDNHSPAREAKAIAVAFRVPEEQVSPNINRLKKEIARHYRDSAPHSPYRLTIHEGGRHATKEKTNFLVELARTDDSPAGLFWRPHIAPPTTLVIVTNAPLFYRHRDGGYRIRVMTVNDKAGLSEHAIKGCEPRLEECEECFHYVSMGDFRLSVALGKYFSSQDVNVETKIVYATKAIEDDYNPPDQVDLKSSRNLIILGNPRVSWVVNKFLERVKPNFFLAADDQRLVHNRQPEKGELSRYQDQLRPGGKLYAALIRDCSKDRIQTAICVQNGPALEGLASLLTDDSMVSSLMKQTGWTGEFPEYFELLFEISIGSKEEISRDESPRLLAWRNKKSETV